ncbi:histidinol-phosphatase [Rhizocola hellebori]|uniref:Histidinol-phosphatase n=1 Tax=Rhizocola hellebori TaxID=1392758 RepID=A0A8J3Q325_9ACTN|nr:histidinol-phosphatase [Rhizocola hellebori]GIH02552.1 histidinol-phosphatase [Rhizocola hellebori]
MSQYEADLALALALADTADAISMARFLALDLQVRAKPDLTPVSDADTAVEQALLATLERTRPEDAVLGEEFGTKGERGARQWIIDPIDGTKNFVRGVPLWATLIALVDAGKPVVGVVSAPALSRRWWASAGAGAHVDRQGTIASGIRVSQVERLEDASFCYSSLPEWEQIGRLDPMLDLMRDTWRSRAYGDFYGYMLLAEGALDIVVELQLAVWDMAALVPIVLEAGGEFTDIEGTPGPNGGNAIATNGKLHAEVVGRLGGR